MTEDKMLETWLRLETAFHDNLPNQGEPGDTAYGKALCQFLYDNSETIRSRILALSERIDVLEAENAALREKRRALAHFEAHH
jgi:hypothetical protein